MNGEDRRPPPSRSLRLVVTNFGSLATATLLGQVIGFVVLARVARQVGPSNLGAWYLAVAIAGYFALPASLGMNILATREIAQQRERFARIAGETMVARGALAFLSYGLLLLLTPLIAGSDQMLAIILPIAGLNFVIVAVSLDWALLAIQKASIVAVFLLAGQIVYGILGILLITSGVEGTIRYAWLNALGLAITGVASIWYVYARVGVVRPVVSPRVLARRAWKSVPFGATLVLYQVYNTLGTVLLGLMGSRQDVALYSVAQKVPQTVMVLVPLWLVSLYPHSSALAEERPDLLASQIGRISSSIAVLIYPAVLIAAIVATPLMVGLFGPSYSDAGTPFVLLVLLAGVMAASSSLTNALFAVGEERRYLRYVGAGAIISVLLNVSLIPTIGVSAPPTATLMAELAVVALCVRCLRRKIGPIPFHRSRLVRSIPGCVIATASAAAGAQWGVAAALILSASSYCAVCLAFRVVTVREMRSGLRRLVSRDTRMA